MKKVDDFINSYNQENQEEKAQKGAEDRNS